MLLIFEFDIIIVLNEAIYILCKNFVRVNGKYLIFVIELFKNINFEFVPVIIQPVAVKLVIVVFKIKILDNVFTAKNLSLLIIYDEEILIFPIIIFIA